MALRPPYDFAPPPTERASPSAAELRDLWERHEAARRKRDRAEQWRGVLEGVRRDADGDLRPATSSPALPAYLRDRLSLGPQARNALRPVPRDGRVIAAGVDTWSPCWYAEPGSSLARAMRALATYRTRLAWLFPERVGDYRVGWFSDHGLVFAEGRPGGEGLASAAELPLAMARLRRQLRDLGVPIAAVPSAGLRRLDVASDLWADSAAEGLAFLECVGSASLGPGKLAAYRSERCIESVLIKTRVGRTQARVYDKGVQSGRAPRGRWLRLEAQWRFPRATRIDLDALDAALLRERFARRFTPLWQAAGGFRLGGLSAVGERIAAAVAAGQLLPSRARSIAGYLVLAGAGVPQGARRTTYEFERECRELGLSVSLLQSADRRLDVATILDECMAPEVWQRGLP
jgi:hypothetical protein